MLVALFCKSRALESGMGFLANIRRLQNGVRVGEKVDASGSINLNGGEQGISIAGKVSASGHVEITGWVEVGGDVKSSGHIKIQSFDSRGLVKIGGKIDCSGACIIEGDMVAE